MRRLRHALSAGVLLLAGCSMVPAPSAASLTVTSTDLRDGSAVPAAFTCTGAGHRPALSWTGRTAAAWAIVVDDPDAPGGDFYHWVITDLPGSTTSVGGTLPAGAVEATNSAGTTGWTPPCPPSGTHHYRFTVYAERKRLKLSASTSAARSADQINRDAAAWGRLTGLVTRS